MNRACPICGGTEADKLHTQHFSLPAESPLPSRYDVVACSKCGFVYANTSATQADYDKVYEDLSKYQDRRTASGGGESAWDNERLEETATTIIRYLENRESRVLDVGCANGGLLYSLKNRGFENVFGIDPSEGCVHNSVAKGIAAKVGSLRSLTPDTGRFDMIVLAHVLEHLLTPAKAIESVAACLAPGGVLYLEVPDSSQYHKYLYSPFQDFNTEHINHFSHTALSNLVSQVGFRPVEESSKVMRCSQDCYYPAIYGLYRQTEGAPPERPMVRDCTSKERLLEYINGSRVLMSQLSERIDGVLNTSPRVIVWGTGELALKLFIDTSLKDAKDVFCVDGNPLNAGRTIHGRLIAPPSKDLPSERPIIIASPIHELGIRKDIHNLGLTNQIISLRV